MHAAKAQFSHNLKMRLRVHQRKRRIPIAAEDEALRTYLQMLAQCLNISDEMLGRIFAKFAAGHGSTCAALVEENDTIVEWVEVEGAGEGRAAAGTAVEEDDLFGGLVEMSVYDCGSYLAFHLGFRTVRSVVCEWYQQTACRSLKALNVRSRAHVLASFR